METTLRAPSLCPGDVKHISTLSAATRCFCVCVYKVESRFTFFAIQRTLSSWPFRILHMRTGCAEGSSGLHGVQGGGGVGWGVRV